MPNVQKDKSHTEEEMRYGFGKNWAEFIERRLSETAIEESREHMSGFMRTDSLVGKIFLDIGSGSGIHSLAALRLGASQIISFDYDADAVATTRKVREIAGCPEHWTVMQGSVLDRRFMTSLPEADIVYSWGVLHHTGDMWNAVRNAAIPLKRDGLFYIALYSSDNYVDPPPQYWLDLKRAYNTASEFGKRLMEWRYFLRFHGIPELMAGRSPFALIQRYGERGMTYWTDVKDWLGGWPMDFASFAETQAFCEKELELSLVNVLTGEGCTEYLFCRAELNALWRAVLAQRTMKVIQRPFMHQGGQAYSIALPELVKSSDSNEKPRRSRLMLYEDGAMLGLAHSPHDHIRRFGGGRFSHWGAMLHFSSSSGSDPNANGRRYSYCERF